MCGQQPQEVVEGRHPLIALRIQPGVVHRKRGRSDRDSEMRSQRDKPLQPDHQFWRKVIAGRLIHDLQRTPLFTKPAPLRQKRFRGHVQITVGTRAKMHSRIFLVVNPDEDASIRQSALKLPDRVLRVS